MKRVDRINLIPKDHNASLLASREVQIAGLSLVLLLVICALTAAKAINVSHAGEEISKVTEELQTIKRELAEMNLNDSGSSPQAKLDIAQKLLDQQILWIEILKEISLLTSSDVWLEALSSKVEKEQILLSIAAEAVSQKSMSEYVEKLESSYYFRNIRFKSSSNVAFGEKSYYQFQLEASVALNTRRKGSSL